MIPEYNEYKKPTWAHKRIYNLYERDLPCSLEHHRKSVFKRLASQQAFRVLEKLRFKEDSNICKSISVFSVDCCSGLDIRSQNRCLMSASSVSDNFADITIFLWFAVYNGLLLIASCSAIDPCALEEAASAASALTLSNLP